MKAFTFLLMLFLPGLNVIAYGQIRSVDLQGEWFTNNDDSLYFKSDTIELFSRTNYFQKFTTCHIIKWIVNKHNFHFESVNRCAEPGIIIVTQYIDQESLILNRNALTQYIEYFRAGIKIDSFEVLFYYEEKVFQNPYNIKILKLKRLK
jgi:hypothetical protein